jgi:hypothetical protein
MDPLNPQLEVTQVAIAATGCGLVTAINAADTFNESNAHLRAISQRFPFVFPVVKGD